MKKLLTAVAAAVACAAAGAQTSNFEGFSAALNLNTVSTNSKISLNGVPVFDGVGQQSWNGSLQAAYGFGAGPSTVVSVGGTYALGDSKGGKFGTDEYIAQIRAKNVYSVYVEPGFLLNDRTLAYGKLSYEGAKGTGALPGEGERSRSMRGSGFGAGFRTMLNQTSFVQVEFKQVSYNSIGLLVSEGASIKPKATLGTIGFGMKF